MMLLIAIAMLVVSAPSARAFNIIQTSRSNFHPSKVPYPFHSGVLFNSSPTDNASPASVNTKPKKRRAPKKVKPTARFVAISSLANAAASTYESCSSDGAGAQVNAGSFATRLLEQDTYYQSLEPRDRSFARLLVATVERRLGQIDKVLKCCIEKYPPKKGKHSHVIQATLRIGVAQLLFLQTPPFAANKETVQVLRMYPNNPPVPEPMIKFVNGVLRKLSRPSSADNDETEEEEAELVGQVLLREKTSPRDNIAPWLLKRWRKDWGEEKTNLMCKEIMPPDDSLVTSRIDLSTKYSLGHVSGADGNEELQSLMSNLGEDSILLPQGSIRVGLSLKGDVKSWPEYDDGTWWVQDASSTLPALVLTNALLDKYPPEELLDTHVVDMCSAPGGKTSQLLCAGFGRVTAIEASPRRSRRLVENLSRLGLIDKCEIVVEEGQNWMPGDQHVHGILVDVPCSATGTGARRPDVLRRGGDIKELLETQEMLATHCADNILDAGGIMVYATCSMLKAESENQVKKLIEKGSVETMPIQGHEVPGFEDAIDDNGWLRVLPGNLEGDLSSTDGFFVARLVRK